jgi:hypothetical protein
LHASNVLWGSSVGFIHCRFICIILSPKLISFKSE